MVTLLLHPGAIGADGRCTTLTRRGWAAGLFRDLEKNNALELPGTPGRLFGRASEVGLLCEWLRGGEVRLLTLCGVGGIGKTRLALEVAAAAGTAFRDGARFVELAPIREPALVLSTIHASVEPGEPPVGRDALDALKRTLGKLQLLLVLDNFEQVIMAAPLLSELLAACPRLTILATSRGPLRLSWERAYMVGPLETPADGAEQRRSELLACPSVALLVERMARVGVPAGADSTQLAALANICRRLDGIPLAIELASARAKVLAPTGVLARLDRPLDLLTAGPRDRPARHQALRNTFEWSYDLLAEPERKIFRHLGVFAGGCTLDALARVCGETPSSVAFLDSLERLMDSGLVSRITLSGAPAEPRLVLLEPVREYALELLRDAGEFQTACEQHAATYLDLVERANREIRGPAEREWLPRLERAHANALVALRWFIDSRAAEGSLRLSAALGMFWWVRGFTREGLQRVEEALALPMPDPASARLRLAHAVALSIAGALMFWLGDYARSQELERRALDLFGDAEEPSSKAFATITLGNCALSLGELDRAEAYYRQSLDLYRAAEDARGTAAATMNLGIASLYQENLARAHALLSRSVLTLQAVGDLRSAAFGLRNLALTHCLRQEFEPAQTCVRESLALWRAGQGRLVLPFLLETAAFVAVGTRQHHRALKLAAAAAAQRDDMDTPAPRSWMRQLQSWLDIARASLGEQASASAWSHGLSLSVEDAVAEALGDDTESKDHLPSGATLNGLTPRETDVLRLVASGNTNKEIALGLVVSVATVERHLANVYAKIGARGRTEATAYAITHGLLG